MSTPPDHERPILLRLGPGIGAGEGLRAFLAHPEVACWQLPPPWVLESAGIDLPSALPSLRQVTPEVLDEVLEALEALCTRERLVARVRRLWGEVPEAVRGYYLERGALETFAAIFRLGPRSADVEPPPAFVQDRVAEHAFTVEYRLRDAGALRRPEAPPGEGSIVFYPFDPAHAQARLEAALPPGGERILEVFAYAEGRARHRRVLDEVAGPRGWLVVDPFEDAAPGA